jgi:hypothetical protein
VAAIDLGIKGMTPTLMAKEGIEVHVLPATATIADVLAVPGADGTPGPDGVFFSNGPATRRPPTSPCCTRSSTGGSPSSASASATSCLGRALGFGTYKLKYGHRGINQPVMDRTTGKVEVTAHNHGFAVDAPIKHDSQTPYGRVRVSHICLNDEVVEGLECLDLAGLLRAVPPGGGGGAARRGIPLRPLLRAHAHPPLEGGPACLGARTSRASWSSGPARSSSDRPASSTTPAPRPAGCCATKASGSSWSTPTRRRS